MDARINLNLYATLRQYMPQGADAFVIQPDETVDSLVSRLGFPQDKIKLVFINGVLASLDHPVNDGDRVGIFPPIGGG